LLGFEVVSPMGLPAEQSMVRQDVH
jgi:hypothetical protein